MSCPIYDTTSAILYDVRGMQWRQRKKVVLLLDIRDRFCSLQEA